MDGWSYVEAHFRSVRSAIHRRFYEIIATVGIASVSRASPAQPECVNLGESAGGGEILVEFLRFI